MVQINFAQKSVTVKIVYYGPGMSGKTTNLEVVHQRAPENSRGDLTSISTDGDRTLFFDFMPLDLGTVAGMRTQFQIYTVPGQVYYNSTRKLVLQGVDGVIFIADSSASMLQENLESLRNLEENLAEYGKDIETVPYVVQYNKRDLPDAMPVAELEKALNVRGVPSFEGVANTGQGVFPTLKGLAALVLNTIHEQTGTGGRGARNAEPQTQQPHEQPAPAAQPPVQSAGTGFYPAPTGGGPAPDPNQVATPPPLPVMSDAQPQGQELDPRYQASPPPQMPPQPQPQQMQAQQQMQAPAQHQPPQMQQQQVPPQMQQQQVPPQMQQQQAPPQMQQQQAPPQMQQQQMPPQMQPELEAGLEPQPLQPGLPQQPTTVSLGSPADHAPGGVPSGFPQAAQQPQPDQPAPFPAQPVAGDPAHLHSGSPVEPHAHQPAPVQPPQAIFAQQAQAPGPGEPAQLRMAPRAVADMGQPPGAHAPHATHAAGTATVSAGQAAQPLMHVPPNAAVPAPHSASRPMPAATGRIKPRSNALPTPRDAATKRGTMTTMVFVALALVAGIAIGGMVFNIF